MSKHGEFLDAAAAARFLGVQRATLYAYVSRGLIRSRGRNEGRERLYLRADLARLKARRRRGRAPADALSGALHWGEPVLESAITRITADGPVYRGRLATELARAGCRFEAVAELLWNGALPDVTPQWPRAGLGTSASRLASFLDETTSPLGALSLLLAALGARDAGRFDRSPQAVLARARTLVPRMAAALALPLAPQRVPQALREDTLAGAVAIAARGSRDRDLLRVIDQALVLVADHELNVSAFAARVAASADADIYACLAAALAALSGPKHGGFVERVEALVAETGTPERARQVVHERARRDEIVPGFGHPLYPQGDPRAVPLLEAARALAGRTPAVRTLFALIEAMRESGRPAPTIDAGLVAVSSALGMPRGFGVTLFAIGRSAGWVAHVLEQHAAGFLIRPRALYRERTTPSPERPGS
jgi:citrate synthase